MNPSCPEDMAKFSEALLQSLRDHMSPLVEAEALMYAAEECIPGPEAVQFAAFCVAQVATADEATLPWMTGWVRSLAIRSEYERCLNEGAPLFWEPQNES